MKRRYDLHTHTTCSDGTLTPTALVERAHAHGVDVLALTDHDTTAGIAEAQTAAERVGITLLPGVEISVTWQNQTLHIVALDVDVDTVPLQDGLAALCKFRDWRAREISRRLQKKHIAGTYEHAADLARGRILSRTHFARALVAQGYARDSAQAFKHYLGRGKPGHVPGAWASLPAAVGWIRAAGGHAVIAHPARYKLGSGKLQRLLGEFKECGGVGIEVISGSQSESENKRFADIAVRQGLLASVGSDYHGPEKRWLELGRLPPLPAGCTPIWEAFRKKAA